MVFYNPALIRDVTTTFISLISKVDKLANLTHFRPIRLCNVSYKLITKILASKLKGSMPKLINQTQSNFVSGRETSDNILMVQEVVHSMKQKKGESGIMAIKIDLEKAYDRLKWDFIRDTLEDMGLPHNFVKLVYECISFVNMSLLWNRGQTSYFKPSRGIRQGDPMSPYIFVLCMRG